MNETQNQKPGRRLSRMFTVWLIFFAASVLMIITADLMPPPQKHPLYLGQALIALTGSVFMFGLWCLIRWCGNPRNFGRFLVRAASFATLVAIFYMEEDWRGKRALEQCKTELEAKGFVMDWDKYIPPPVPDDQNFFTASTNILLRFKRAQTEAEANLAQHNSWLLIKYDTNSFPVFDNTKSGPLLVATITIVPAASSGPDRAINGPVVKLNQADAPQQIQDLIQKTIGQSALGSAGFRFSEIHLSDLTPARLRLQADTPVSISDFKNLVPVDLATNLGHLRVEAGADANTFQVLLADAHVTAAADFLKWSDQFVPAFDELREALKRPSAILPGDYSRPYLIPIPNFITIRAVAQMLAQRAQCDFLSGKPDEALHEITLMHDLCRILQKPPTGKPETLVEAMINVAIAGLYVNTIADGLRLHVWQEPQLIALQQQLQSITLPMVVAEAFRDEVAASTHTLEICTPSELVKILGIAGNQSPGKLWEKLGRPDFWLSHLAPRGWYYQNMAVSARLSENNANAFDLPNNLIQPGIPEANMAEISKALRHWSPWNFWANIAIPNLTKATETTAYNQTLANEGQVTCALERYRLAHGEYPATLDALVPQFIEQLPHDLIGGQPLHYRRVDAPSAQGSDAAGGKFLLYSVGWNKTDDGGLPGTLQDVKKGDWVWTQ